MAIRAMYALKPIPRTLGGSFMFRGETGFMKVAVKEQSPP